MPEFTTTKCILKLKWICPNPDCDAWVPGEAQTTGIFRVAVVRRHQVVDVKCDHCHKTTRCEIN